MSKHFDLRGSWSGALFSRTTSHRVVHAVDDVTLAIRPAEIVAIVGESGSGKTTLGKTILRLYGPTVGRILYRPRGGDPAAEPFSVGDLRAGSPKFRAYRRATQTIFQDPYDSLDPKLTIFDIVEEPLRAHHLVHDPAEVQHRIEGALEAVRLTPPHNFLDRYPHELSGGERQRVAAARALVLRPDILVADEPISMLDVSLRAGFLNLLQGLRREFGMSILYITHDIVSARYLADRILVMYLGVTVEGGMAEETIRVPLHPYTKALIQAVPTPNPNWTPGTLEIVGTVGNAIDIPAGCRFSRRCPYRQTQCDTVVPSRRGSDDHWYLCHFTQEELAAIRAAAPLGGGRAGAVQVRIARPRPPRRARGGRGVLRRSGAPPALLGLYNYGRTMPLFLFIGGILVMFIGAWYDFGAREVVGDLVEHHLPFGPTDLDYLYRQQFWLTMIYLGIAGLYMTTAVTMFLWAGGAL